MIFGKYRRLASTYTFVARAGLIGLLCRSEPVEKKLAPKIKVETKVSNLSKKNSIFFLIKKIQILKKKNYIYPFEKF